MEKLYCTHCKKSFSVAEEAIRLMQDHGKKLPKAGNEYHYMDGCFFKDLAKLKKQKPSC